MRPAWLAAWLSAQAADRDPLPALAVERPLALPRGWVQLELGTLVQGPRRRWGGRLRYGALRGLELFWDAGLVHQQGLWGPSDPGLGVRLELLRREPPNTALAIELSWTAPYGAEPQGVPLASGEPELGLVGQLQRQAGPVLGRVELGPRARGGGPEALYGGLGLIVQLGPLAPGGTLQGELRSDGSRWTLGEAELLLQVSRGLALRGSQSWPILGEDADPTLPDAPRSALALEIAL
jgi:hypothetical protein